MCSVSGLVCSFFFFSSRRRHTRYWRDWSSDVCSSDLGRDDSLSRTAVSQQDHYGYYQLVWLVHPVEGGAFGGREGFFRTACSGSASPSGRGSRRVLLRLGRRPSNARCGKIALAGSWDTS